MYPPENYSNVSLSLSLSVQPVSKTNVSDLGKRKLSSKVPWYVTILVPWRVYLAMT